MGVMYFLVYHYFIPIILGKRCNIRSLESLYGDRYMGIIHQSYVSITTMFN